MYHSELYLLYLVYSNMYNIYHNRKRKRLSCKVSKRNSVELLDGTFYRLVTTLNTTNRNLVKIRNKQNCNICRCLVSYNIW